MLVFCISLIYLSAASGLGLGHARAGGGSLYKIVASSAVEPDATVNAGLRSFHLCTEDAQEIADLKAAGGWPTSANTGANNLKAAIQASRCVVGLPLRGPSTPGNRWTFIGTGLANEDHFPCSSPTASVFSFSPVVCATDPSFYKTVSDAGKARLVNAPAGSPSLGIEDFARNA